MLASNASAAMHQHKSTIGIPAVNTRTLRPCRVVLCWIGVLTLLRRPRSSHSVLVAHFFAVGFYMVRPHPENRETQIFSLLHHRHRTFCEWRLLISLRQYTLSGSSSWTVYAFVSAASCATFRPRCHDQSARYGVPLAPPPLHPLQDVSFSFGVHGRRYPYE